MSVHRCGWVHRSKVTSIYRCSPTPWEMWSVWDDNVLFHYSVDLEGSSRSMGWASPKPNTGFCSAVWAVMAADLHFLIARRFTIQLFSWQSPAVCTIPSVWGCWSRSAWSVWWDGWSLWTYICWSFLLSFLLFNSGWRILTFLISQYSFSFFHIGR